MVACPYDQLFIDPNTHTAEKCNFCANRVENELLPACVSVCPTECRIFGDLDDPTSEVAQIAQREATRVRKPEKGTIPKVFYIAAEDSVIQPEIATRPFIYKEGQVLLRPLGSPEADPSRPGDARVDYDTPHEKPWGFDMALYLLTKGIATGTMLRRRFCCVVLGDARRAHDASSGRRSRSLFLVDHRGACSIVDLERPERFYYILLRPNWRSWMVWGAYFLTAQGLLTDAVDRGRRGSAAERLLALLVWPLVVCSILDDRLHRLPVRAGAGARPLAGAARRPSTCSRRRSSKARRCCCWRRCSRASAIRASRACSTVTLIVVDARARRADRRSRTCSTPSPTRHRQLAVDAIRRGAFARLFWGGAIAAPRPRVDRRCGARAAAAAGRAPRVLALAGSFAWEYIWVEAGQSVPLS